MQAADPYEWFARAIKVCQSDNGMRRMRWVGDAPLCIQDSEERHEEDETYRRMRRLGNCCGPPSERPNKRPNQLAHRPNALEDGGGGNAEWPPPRATANHALSVARMKIGAIDAEIWVSNPNQEDERSVRADLVVRLKQLSKGLG